jgi:hypothetical protein
MGTIYAKYHARCWAEGKTVKEIENELKRLDKPRNYDWQDTGNAHMDYVRIETLKEILNKRSVCHRTA